MITWTVDLFKGKIWDAKCLVKPHYVRNICHMLLSNISEKSISEAGEEGVEYQDCLKNL